MINARVTCRFERIGDFCSVAYLHILSNFKEIPEEIFLFVPDILFLIKRNPVRLCSFEFDYISQESIPVYTCEETRLDEEIRVREELTFLSQICASPCYSSLFPPQQKGRGTVRSIHAPVEHQDQDGRYAIPLVRDYDSALLSQLVKEIEQQCGVISPEEEFLGPNSFGQLEFRSGAIV